MEGTHNALINLATEAASDRETMMSKCKTMANLAKNISALTKQLQQANTVYNRGSGIPVDRKGQANPKWVNGKHVCDVGGYCWTHRHCVDIIHDSRTCRSKREGHMENVTRADNMGGNPYGKARA